MNNSNTELELKEFFIFLNRNKLIFLLISSLFLLAGGIKSFFVERSAIASVGISLPTLRDISILNFEFTANPKLQSISPYEVYTLYKDTLYEQSKDSANGIQLRITPNSPTSLRAIVVAHEPQQAVNYLEKTLLDTKKIVLNKLLKLSNQALITIQDQIKKDIKTYTKLLQELETATGAEFPFSDVIDKKKQAIDYRNILDNYKYELLTMHPIMVSFDQIELYTVSDNMKIQPSSSIWSVRLKIIMSFFIIGFLVSFILFFLFFLTNTKNS